MAQNETTPRSKIIIVLITAAALLASACASRKYVQRELEPVRQKTTVLEEQMEHAQEAISESEERISEQERELEAQQQALSEASQTARDAYDRAVAAGKLAEGKLLFETTFSEDRIRFRVDRAELTDEAKSALDELATTLVARGEGVYLEIQGHTDSTGSEDHNLQLGEERAEAVRRYLNSAHGLPLHRIATISYGESAPVADNATRDGRSKNRRVVVVVLR